MSRRRMLINSTEKLYVYKYGSSDLEDTFEVSSGSNYHIDAAHVPGVIYVYGHETLSGSRQYGVLNVDLKAIAVLDLTPWKKICAEVQDGHGYIGCGTGSIKNTDISNMDYSLEVNGAGIYKLDIRNAGRGYLLQLASFGRGDGTSIKIKNWWLEG